MNSAKINIACDFAGAGGDAGVKFETVYSGYPEFLILNLKAYFLGNWVFCDFCYFGFCILFFFLGTFDTQGKVMTQLEVLA